MGKCCIGITKGMHFLPAGCEGFIACSGKERDCFRQLPIPALCYFWPAEVGRLLPCFLSVHYREDNQKCKDGIKSWSEGAEDENTHQRSGEKGLNLFLYQDIRCFLRQAEEKFKLHLQTELVQRIYF